MLQPGGFWKQLNFGPSWYDAYPRSYHVVTCSKTATAMTNIWVLVPGLFTDAGQVLSGITKWEQTAEKLDCVKLSRELYPGHPGQQAAIAAP
jgi:hypothetical protein